MSWPFKLVKISGHSMQPTIHDRQVVLVNRWAYLFKKTRIGDIVVFRYGNEFWCKRIISAENITYQVQGDNVADSLETPAIFAKQIIGKIFPMPNRTYGFAKDAGVGNFQRELADTPMARMR